MDRSCRVSDLLCADYIAIFESICEAVQQALIYINGVTRQSKVDELPSALDGVAPIACTGLGANEIESRFARARTTCVQACPGGHKEISLCSPDYQVVMRSFLLCGYE